MLPDLALTTEGSTELYVPRESLSSKDPSTFPAFFNPAARLNRDVSVAVVNAFHPADFLDAMAGTGARGVRIANEAKKVDVTLVEFNQVSARIAARNIKRNGVGRRCEIVRQESIAFLSSRFGRLERFEAVDVDPFGTPAPYVLGALNAAQDGGMVSLTATDTATLCGVYPAVALRRYGASLVKSEFSREAGIRALLAFSARMGGILDIGIEPVAAHCTLHYMRVYFRVLRRAASSDLCLKGLGYVVACPTCHENTVAPQPAGSCPRCGGRAKSLGPQWLGKIADEAIVSKAAGYCHERGWRGGAESLEGLLKGEGFPPYAFSLERITSREKISSMKLSRVFDALASRGRSATRQAMGPAGIKTDATYAELLECVREAARA